MPVPNRPAVQYRWWPIDLYPNGLPSGSEGQYVRRQQGWKRQKGDDPNQVFRYNGSIGYGHVVRNPEWPRYASPPAADYCPLHTTWWNAGHVTQSPWWAIPAINQAYSRFVASAVGDFADLGTAIAEYKSTFGMISKRARQLYRAFQHCRKGNLGSMLNELGVKRALRKHRTRKFRKSLKEGTHEVSSLWLEYWFGWAPTVNDLYMSSKILTDPWKLGKAVGRGVCKYDLTEDHRNGAYDRYYWQQACKVVYRTGANVLVTNPNALLRNKLGLANPAQTAWELVPFSFVIDWFTKFGNVISSWTELQGITLENPYVTIFYHGVYEVQFGSRAQFAVGKQSAVKSSFIHQTRKEGLLGPMVERPRFLNVASSRTRAASAVSLLTQALSLHKR